MSTKLKLKRLQNPCLEGAREAGGASSAPPPDLDTHTDLKAGARACCTAETVLRPARAHAVPRSQPQGASRVRCLIMGHRTGPHDRAARREPAAADPAIWPVPRRGAELLRAPLSRPCRRAHRLEPGKEFVDVCDEEGRGKESNA